MRLAVKHEKQQPVIRADFSGGLNTVGVVEGIEENQLAVAINLEVEHATGKLRTVSGTRDVFQLKKEELFAVVYDEINKAMLIVRDDRRVFLVDFEGRAKPLTLGKLTGKLYPKYEAWDRGVLIASGGQLQYFNGEKLQILDTPPAEEVKVRGGRVMIAHGRRLFYSGVGDENDWLIDNNSASSSKWLEIGYKDGARIVGLASLANEVLILKSNQRAYRLQGEFDEWQLIEVGRAIGCKTRRSQCVVGDEVFVLNWFDAHFIQEGIYGTARPENIGLLVSSELERLPPETQARFLPSLNQVWLIGGTESVLIYDVVLKSWWKRKFNAEVRDAFGAGKEVYVVKRDRISVLDSDSFLDNGKAMEWKMVGQRLVSHHDFLLKRTKVLVTPLNEAEYLGEITAGKVKVPLPCKTRRPKSPIYQTRLKLASESKNRGREMPQSEERAISKDTYSVESRNVYRKYYLDIEGRGKAVGFILHSITLDIAEV